MPFEIQDDWDDDALAGLDVDAMVAAKRPSAPPTGQGPSPAQFRAPAAPRYPQQPQPPAQQQQPPAWHPQQQPHHHHHHAQQHAHGGASRGPGAPQPSSPPGGFSGHPGRNGGFSGNWQQQQQQQRRRGSGGHQQQPARWRTGHDAVDRATAAGVPRGAPAPDCNQRTMNQMFAAKSGPQRDDKQRTLVSMFGGGGGSGGSGGPAGTVASRAHDHQRPLDLTGGSDDDWNVGAWGGAVVSAPPRHPRGTPSARPGPGARFGDGKLGRRAGDADAYPRAEGC